MASRNRTSRYVSTKRTFRVNKGNDQNASAAILQEQCTTSADNQVQRSPNNYLKLNGTNQQTNNQNYSARNSLRAAQSTISKPEIGTNKSANHSLPFTMPESIGATLIPPLRCLEDSSNYLFLTSDCFVRVSGDFIVCMLCGKRERIDYEDAAENHLCCPVHNSRLSKLRSTFLDRPLNDTSLQMTAINELLTTWYKSQSLNHRSIEAYFAIFDELNAILEKHFPDSYCRLIGSFSSGTPLKGSDINVELVHPNSALFERDPRAKNSIHHKLVEPDAEFGDQFNNHALYYDLAPNAISTMYELIQLLNNKYREHPLDAFEVTSEINDLNGKVPRLILRHIKTMTNVEINCYVSSSHQLSILLGIYMSLDGRARVLSILVKYWAKLCGISKPEQGTFPPYAFVILVIYFLQRTSPPILPCLHMLLGGESKPDTNELDSSAAEQLERLDLGSRIPASQETVRGPPNSKSVTDNIEVDDADLDDDDEEEVCSFDLEKLNNLQWQSDNETRTNQLFIDFMRFYMKEFEETESVISIRTLKKVSLRSRKWGTIVKAIENPVRPRVNISRCIGTLRIADYIKNCFKNCYYYLTSIPIELPHIQPKTTTEVHPEDFTSIYFNSNKLDNYYFYKEKMIKTTVSYDSIREMIHQDLFARDVEVINFLFDKAGELNQTHALPAQVARFYKDSLLRPTDVNCTSFCFLCRRTGHIKQSCPQRKLLNLNHELETYNPELDIKANLDLEFNKAYQRDKISPQLAAIHAQVVEQISDLIKSGTGLKCQLQLFGSTVNNLGSYDSDLDICMTIEGYPSGRNVDCVGVLRKVAQVLESTPEASNVEPILTARVPIIKFRYNSYDIDLSMYNECAIFNSKLMKTYSEIDDRVALLFYLVKRYAKTCGIADATKGSLSSYAWSLLVIHYLQKIDPPILPFLQDPDQDGATGLVGVNGWNVWFDSKPDISKLEKNKMNITQLFKDFFLYYGNFDFEYDVISIRKKGITRFQKSWNNCTIAIEDPFELTYNLASRLDELMSIYIINSFSQAFKHIVSIQRYKARVNMSPGVVVKRIFNQRDITGFKPPYRGCRVCHKIGHKLKECPIRAQTLDMQAHKNRN